MVNHAQKMPSNPSEEWGITHKKLILRHVTA
jgi:hypothetical protein